MPGGAFRDDVMRFAPRDMQLLSVCSPAELLQKIVYYLTLAHEIAGMAPTCRQLCDAAKLARKLRPFSGEVVTLAGHTNMVLCVAVAPAAS